MGLMESLVGAIMLGACKRSIKRDKKFVQSYNQMQETIAGCQQRIDAAIKDIEKRHGPVKRSKFSWEK